MRSRIIGPETASTVFWETVLNGLLATVERTLSSAVRTWIERVYKNGYVHSKVGSDLRMHITRQI